jgi:lysophospholipase L1-like esterase
VAVAAVILAAILGIVAALEVTPMQTVNVAGQVIKVGAAPRLGFSGRGEVDLFGQGLPTALSIPGPIQPRLQLSQITLNSELANFVQGRNPSHAGLALRTQLVAGWEHYFAWETAAAALAALILAGAVAGWRRLGGRATALVLGDSTAAGAGLPPVAHPSTADHGCGRSSQSYALDIASVNSWRVLNLACDSATIAHGLLGPQPQGGLEIPPQIDSLKVQDPTVVIVSVGADDLQWSAILKICAAMTQCDSRASNAYFQQKLAQFSTAYLQLLIQLGSLPGHPRVIINRYYDPFGSDVGCITQRGLTAAKVATIQTWLAALNKVLAKGAAQFGFQSPQPSFAGHTLCTPQPYVQGLADPAPFHPTAEGQFAIALTDEVALTSPPPQPPPPSKSPSSG